MILQIAVHVRLDSFNPKFGLLKVLTFVIRSQHVYSFEFQSQIRAS